MRQQNWNKIGRRELAFPAPVFLKHKFRKNYPKFRKHVKKQQLGGKKIFTCQALGLM